MIRPLSASVSLRHSKHVSAVPSRKSNICMLRARPRITPAASAAAQNAGEQEQPPPATVQITAREGGVAINVTGNTEALTRVAGYLSSLAALAPAARGGGAKANGSNNGVIATTAGKAAPALPPPTPPPSQPAPLHLEPCTLDDATHIVWGGLLQPLHRPGDGGSDSDYDETDGDGYSDDSEDEKFSNSKGGAGAGAGDDPSLPTIELFVDATLRKTTNSTSKRVTYKMLRRAPLLRLPCGGGAATADALAALLEAGAVPGVALCGRGPQRPAGCGGREYAFFDGVLSPVYGTVLLERRGAYDEPQSPTAYVYEPPHCLADVPAGAPRFFLRFKPGAKQ